MNPQAPSPKPSQPPDINHDQYIVDDIFPANAIHLICGPSGAGKSRWTFTEVILPWHRGEDVLGYKSHPEPFAYISCDRPKASVLRTLDSIEVKPDFPIISIMGRARTLPTFQSILAAIPADTRVLFIEPLQVFAKRANDYLNVWEWFQHGYTLCEERGLTILGSCHTTKVKEDQQFINPREKILGSVAWGGCAETVVAVEPVFGKGGATSQRKVTVMPRNFEQEELLYDFNDKGILVQCDDAQQAAAFMLEQESAKLKMGDLITADDFRQWAASFKISRRSVERWIRKMCEIGRLERVQKGVYKIRGIS